MAIKVKRIAQTVVPSGHRKALWNMCPLGLSHAEFFGFFWGWFSFDSAVSAGLLFTMDFCVLSRAVYSS